MRGAVLHAPGDVRCEPRADPVIIEPTDAIVRTVATCVCGSDLWPYRGIDQVTRASAIGHEYCGIVEQIGDAVALVQPGQFVIGGFLASDNTCPNCPAGVHSSCLQGTGYDGCQSELIRVPLADGTPVPTPELPAKDLVPNLLTLSDVMATGRHTAVSAGVKQGMTVAVVRGRRGWLVRCAGNRTAGRRAGDRHEPSSAGSALLTGWNSRCATCSGGTSGYAAERYRCGTICRTCWIASGTARSTRERCSTWSCLCNRSPKPTGPWTSAARSKYCCVREYLKKGNQSWSTDVSATQAFGSAGLRSVA
jgi:hypothetical protein